MHEQLKLSRQLCFPLYVCARKVTGLYTPFFKPLGITYTQYIVLLALWEQDDQTVSELCERLYLDSGTLTPLLKKMEQNGLLTRTRSSQDERVVRIRLSEKGRAMEEEAARIPAEVGSCLHISRQDAAALHRILYQIMEEEEPARA